MTRFTSGFRAGVDNRDWITADDVPDPDKLPEVHGWNILLRPIPIRNRTGKTGSIIMSENQTDDIRALCNVARVIKVGPLAYKDTERTGDTPWVKEGDLVVFPRFTGTRFLYKGIRMVLIEDTAMLMTIEDAGDVDPNFNIGLGD